MGEMAQLAALRGLARHYEDIRTGRLPFDFRTGACMPVQATQLRSWGSACPSGACLPDNLPEALGRWFAGDRNGCRELPFCVHLSATSSATLVTPVTLERTSKVTACPTRLLAFSDAPRGHWELTSVVFGNQNQIVGDPVAVEAFDNVAFQAVPMVPDCLRAGQPYSISANLLPDVDTPTARNLWLVFIGPVVG